ncbi:TolC family protein [Curvibacter sp. HBC61]|uniref:TolC family protein n=1 Tax=Curvibacter cyanobacteriorum TaxID=3026422 RepID=A0ABT5MTG2_9BURK|nr:TolC family protein [Curvibacter sp. HBC61]MDD0837118.1 TolC family protein [Curvibacter sp. HBC61]
MLRSLWRAAGLSLLPLLVGGPALAQWPPSPARPDPAPSAAPAVAPSTASPARLLSLSEAFERAEAVHPELVQARREVEALQGPVLQARLRPNPELAYALEDRQSATRSQTLQLNWRLETGGKREARVAVSEQAVRVAQSALQQVRTQVRTLVLSAYADALLAQERAALAQDNLGLARRVSEAVAKRVAAGKVSPVEESKARVAEAGARLEQVQALSEQRSSLRRLVSLWGQGPALADGLRLSDLALPLPTLPDWAALAARVDRAPGRAVAQQELLRRQAAVEVERRRQVPDVTLSLGLKRANELQRNQLLLGLSVPLPVSDRNQGNLLEALQREEQAREALSALDQRLGTDAWLAHERLATGLAELRLLQQEVLPGARQAYEAASVGFEFGKFSFLEVLDAQRTHLAAKAQSLRAVADVQRAAAELERLLGTPLAEIESAAPTRATQE